MRENLLHKLTAAHYGTVRVETCAEAAEGMSSQELRWHLAALSARVMLELLLGARWADALGAHEVDQLLALNLRRLHVTVVNDAFMLTAYRYCTHIR